MLKHGTIKELEAWTRLFKYCSMPKKSIILDLTAEPMLEDKVPLPTRYRSLTAKYPFEKMKIGQSFFVAGEPLQTCRRLCQAVANFKKKDGGAKDFVVRSRSKSQPEAVNPLKEVGSRVWRTE